VRIAGAEHLPAEGAAIVAPNHKSFLDAFFIGLATRRHVRFMAKAELLAGPFGGLLGRLGAFPVRRGESDAQAVETARALLEQGELLVVFPEGTRVEQADALGSPRHGAGRLALETGTPLIPAAITGTQRLWLGPFPKPRRVQVHFLPAVDPRPLAGRPDAAQELIDGLVWPAVQQEYGLALARPGLLLGALAALGLGAGLLARRRQPATPRILGVVEPLKVRRRKEREQRRARVRARVRRPGAGKPAERRAGRARRR
jgi:1-acyl-sn-glycerol-3-phosphate acyltransferase